MDLNEKQARKIDGIMSYITEYLELRFAHACQINSDLRRVKSDLVWQTLGATRHTLGGQRSYGPDRYIIVDILTSFDEKKKIALFSQSDNQSIFPEIVTEAAADQHGGIDIPGVRSAGDFYKALVPALAEMTLLTQSWIWWDLPDAVDLCLMDLQAERIAALSHSEINPQLVNFYRSEMDKSTEEHPGDVTMDEVIAFELERTRKIGHAFEERRAAEPPYQKIIKRDTVDDGAFASHVQNMAQRYRVIEQARKQEPFEPALVEHYSRVFRCEPDEVSAERVLAFETESAATLRASLQSLMESDESLGPPYSFKETQVALVNEKLAHVDTALKTPPASA